ncbi:MULTISPECIES: hypothetical protein [unclassified Ensifer]|uniref:hypothetical protein n=1 Tax=unclassified Ensifer TaxID=2633371 RepID=UPI00300F9430
MRHELDAREYKLLLNPKRFLEAPPDTVADSGLITVHSQGRTPRRSQICSYVGTHPWFIPVGDFQAFVSTFDIRIADFRNQSQSFKLVYHCT